MVLRRASHARIVQCARAVPPHRQSSVPRLHNSHLMPGQKAFPCHGDHATQEGLR